jgi:predicted nuclease of predicted toxin-antitoxin system
MKILFDQGTPVPLRRHLPRHDVATAAEMDWSQLTNGELLAAATEAGFEVLVTTDQNLRYQQNLKERTIAVVVLMTTSWPRIAQQTDRVVDAIKALGTGDYIEVEI